MLTTVKLHYLHHIDLFNFRIVLSCILASYILAFDGSTIVPAPLCDVNASISVVTPRCFWPWSW